MAKEKSPLELLKAQLKSATTARKKEIVETVETRKVQMQLAKLESPAFLEREVTKADSLTLTAIISSFEDLATGSDKVVKPVYGYGAQVDKILTIVRSVRYAKRDYRDAMEAIVGLDEELIEATDDALGSASFYSMANDDIVEAIEPDLPTLRSNLEIIAVELGVTSVKLNKVTQGVVDKMYARASVKALELMENTRNYEADANSDSAEYDV